MTAPWKHVWITGASSGLGEYAARLLAQQGCQVSITARSDDKLQAIASEYPNIAVYPADVTDAARLKDIVSQMEQDHGPVDLAVFSAGAWFQSTIAELKVENVAKTFDVNVMGVVNALDAVLPQMLARGSGHVSWIASVAGYGGLPLSAAYSGSKSALITMAESMMPELKKSGIDISVINPGFVRTPMTDVNEFPMPFLMEPEDAAVKMVDGLKARKFEIAFPWQMVAILKFLNHLPYWAYFKLVKRLI